MRNFILSVCLLALQACAYSTQPISYQYKPICMGVNVEGDIQMKSWGYGPNRAAFRQASQSALKTLLFEGIRDGGTDCQRPPMLTEVNAAEKHHAYFYHFFAKGDYKRYVEIPNQKLRSQRHQAAGSDVQGVILHIHYEKLLQRMQKDNLLSERSL